MLQSAPVLCVLVAGVPPWLLQSAPFMAQLGSVQKLDDAVGVPDTDVQPLLAGAAPPHDGLSTVVTSFFMVGQMIGVGMLGSPVATAQSGWLGLVLLCACCAITWTSANLLGLMMVRMRKEGRAVRDFPSVGSFALGRVGHIAATAGHSSYNSVIYTKANTFKRRPVLSVDGRLCHLRHPHVRHQFVRACVYV